MTTTYNYSFGKTGYLMIGSFEINNLTNAMLNFYYLQENILNIGPFPNSPTGLNNKYYFTSGNYFVNPNDGVFINNPSNSDNAIALYNVYYNNGGNATQASIAYYGLQGYGAPGTYYMYAYDSGLNIIGNYAKFNNVSINSGSSPSVVCFAENSKILCQSDTGKEQYIPIQDIHKGTLVKTMKNIYIPVEMIGKRQIINNNTLYKLSPNKYSELTEDLILTGNHSILVDQISEEQKEKTKQITGDVFCTQDKIRLLAQLDDRSEEYFDGEAHNIYHLALENDNPFENYGIYANGGLLVETASIRTMEEMSGMDLL